MLVVRATWPCHVMPHMPKLSWDQSGCWDAVWMLGRSLDAGAQSGCWDAVWMLARRGFFAPRNRAELSSYLSTLEKGAKMGRGSRCGAWWWMLGGEWWVVWSVVGRVGGGWESVMYPASSWEPRASHRRRTVPPPLIIGSAPPNHLLCSIATLPLEAGGARTTLQSR